MELPAEKNILIAKRFLIEKRVLEKVLANLGYDYTTLENTEQINEELKTGKYDIVFADEDLISDDISQSYSNLAIITASNSKDEIDTLIKKYRG
jgi:DNA-binding NtrC family response regulator